MRCFFSAAVAFTVRAALKYRSSIGDGFSLQSRLSNGLYQGLPPKGAENCNAHTPFGQLSGLKAIRVFVYLYSFQS